MKQMLRKKDVWVLLAALIGAFACVTLIQFISGRIDGVASMVFLLAVFFVSMYTDGYWWGVAGSVISVLAVNFAFRTPYFAFNFTIPENIFSGVVMLVVSFMTSTLTTRIKKQRMTDPPAGPAQSAPVADQNNNLLPSFRFRSIQTPTFYWRSSMPRRSRPFMIFFMAAAISASSNVRSFARKVSL